MIIKLYESVSWLKGKAPVKIDAAEIPDISFDVLDPEEADDLDVISSFWDAEKFIKFLLGIIIAHVARQRNFGFVVIAV